MAFITESDYSHILDQQNLSVLAPTTIERLQAESAAMEEMASYLRGRYDVEALFAQAGDNRNQLILLYVMDMTIYHLFARLEVSGGVPENRKSRYEAAIAWLLDVANGKSNPLLPSYPEEKDEAGITWGSIEKLNNTW